MDHHFRAFSFVDRIPAVPPGGRVIGQYQVPAALDEFPLPLAVEAIGQLAAWVAMAKMDFKLRPVAGIAPQIELLHPVRPGDLLDLALDLHTIATDAVNYDGEASVAGVPVVRVHHVVGPMVPVADFDDPEALRRRYELISGPGAAPGAFAGVPAIGLGRTGGDAGQSVRGSLKIPTDVPLFEDHFPRRPVFPGTLFMRATLQLAEALALELTGPANGSRWVARGITGSKLREFIPPGDELEFEARLGGHDGDAMEIAVNARRGERALGGCRVNLVREAHA